MNKDHTHKRAYNNLQVFKGREILKYSVRQGGDLVAMQVPVGTAKQRRHVSYE